MPDQPQKVRSIPGQVWLLGFVSFFNDISSEILYPVLPIFLTQILGAPVAVVGLIEGCAEGVASVFKGVFGRLSDKMGKRKRFVVGGYASSAVSKVIIALSSVWPFVFAGRTLDRFGKGMRTGARDALLLETANEHNRGLIFGLHRSMDSAGAVLGPLLAVLLLNMQWDIRSILWAATIPALGSIFLFFFIREAHAKPQPSVRVFQLSLKGFSREFRWLLLALGLFSLGNSSDTFLILRAKGLGMTLTTVILAYVLYNVIYTLLSTPAGSVSDRLGAKRVMIIGIALYALVYLGFALTASTAAIWPLFIVYGGYIALTDGVSKALAGQFIAKEQSAAAYGIMQMVTGLGTLFASVIGGLLWSAISPHATFLFAAACAFLSLFLFAALPSGNLQSALYPPGRP
jgi:MFS family permease